MNERGILVLRGPSRFSDLLKRKGLRVILFPVTATRPVTDLSDLESRIERLDHYDGCFFTSPVAAEIFVNAIQSRGVPFSVRIYVLGERCREVFENAGIDVEYRVTANTAREFVSSFPAQEFAGRSFLFVRGDRSVDTLREKLGDIASLDEVVVYETYDLCPEAKQLAEIRNEIAYGKLEWACFFAPSAVDSFLKIFKVSELNGVKTAAIGQTTGERIRESGLPLNFVSSRASSLGFAAELIDQIIKH